jgi:hypothetical protein
MGSARRKLKLRQLWACRSSGTCGVPAPRQIVGRGDDGPPRLGQRRAVRGRCQRAGPEADRDIRLTASDIDHRVGQRDIDAGYADTARAKSPSSGTTHMLASMRQRRTDPQPSARRALVGDLLLGIVEIGEDAPRSEQIGLPLGGERQRAGGAEQQSHAQPRLDPVDRVRATADGVSPSVRPAAEKLPSSTTLAKRASDAGAIVRPATFASKA